MKHQINAEITLECVGAKNYPSYINVQCDEQTVLVIWTKEDALKMAHKLMSLAHELDRNIEKETNHARRNDS